MKRIIIFLCSLSTVCLAAERPNFVFVISDDHDYEHLGFMGNEYVHTPALDELARAGTVFTTAHLPMSRCRPTLASFLSGQWPHQSGIYYNYGKKKLAPKNTLPNLLKNAGYATFGQGKFWEGDPKKIGFTAGKGRDPKNFVRNGQESVYQFIDEVAGKQPFYIWWAPRIPHTPHNPPDKYKELYDKTKMPVPPYVKSNKKPEGKSADSFSEREFTSYAMEAWLDDGVNQLVGKLRSKGLDKNTIFIFVIDNGWCNGAVSKGSPFEKGVRTPIFFTLPGGIKGGQRIDELVSTNDIYPTILDSAGVKIPGTAAGKSLRPALEGKPMQYADTLYDAIYPAYATKKDERPERDVYALYARTREWKYVYYLQDVTAKRNGKYFKIKAMQAEFPSRSAGDENLYALNADPYEQHDLSADPRHRQKLQTFKKQAMAWWKNTGGQPLAVK